MLLVVLYHSMIFWEGTWFTEDPKIPSPILGYFASWLNSFHVYAFTLVSGYLFYFLRFEKKKYQNFGEFVIHKVQRLVVPYCFIAAIWVIPIQWYFFRYDLETIFKNYILGEAPNQLWYLWMLFHVFWIFWLLSDYIARNHIKGGTIVLFIYSFSIIGGNIIPNIYMIWTACEYLIFFWAGFKIRQCSVKILYKVPLWCLIICDMILFSIFYMFPENNSFLGKVVFLGMKLLLNMLGAVTAFLVLQRLADMKGAYKIIQKMETKSMGVYLFHQQIVYIPIFLLNGKINPWIHAALNFMIALLGSLCITSLFMKFQITRRLIGEK